MEQKTKRVLERLRSYSLITFGLLLYALGWTVFLIPSGLVGGGVTGISAVIFYGITETKALELPVCKFCFDYINCFNTASIIIS